MRYLPALCLLLGALAWGQEEPAQQGLPPEYRPPSARDEGPTALPASAASVRPDAAVLTIKGLCDQTSAGVKAGGPNQSCETVITRAQFEALADALVENMKLSRRRQLALGYPNLLAMAHEAEVRGLENSPRFRERIAFARVQILSQELIRQIEQDSAKVSDKDIEDYYRTHADLFERATLERIFVPIPKLKRTAAAKGEASSGAIVEQQKETAIAMSRVAEKLRTKAVGGDSFLSLQKEAYAAAGETDVPPNSSLGQLRSGDLPPAFVSVFTLKAGEVSPVLRDSAGYYIYKLDAKEVEPLATAAGKIRQSLANQRRDEAIQTIQGPISTEVNQAYFGTTEKSEDNKRSSPSGQR